MKRRWLWIALVCMLLINVLSHEAFAQTIVVASGTCGEDLTWTLDSAGTLTVSGTGPMYDMYDWEAYEDISPWRQYAESIKTVVVSEGVTSVGEKAFSSIAVTKAVIADTVKTMNARAFDRCEYLSEIRLSSGLETIGGNAFFHCMNLSDVILPDSLKTIEAGAFWYCYDLGNIHIPANVSEIGPGAFMGAGVTSFSVDSNNAYYCAVDGVLFNKDQTILQAYPGSNERTVYRVPDGVTEIQDSAFFFLAPAEIILPESLEYIGDYAFADTAWYNYLLHIYIRNPNVLFGPDVFYICNEHVYIYGVAGGTTEEYARSKGIAFAELQSYSVAENTQSKVVAGDTLHVVAENDLSELVMVTVDGKLLEDAAYVLGPDGRELTVNENYMQTLAAGEHDLTVVLPDGVMSVNFTVVADLCGDTDRDGEISDWDAILLNRRLAGWNVEIDLSAADVDGDGEISDWDAIVLERYLAGWDVALGV